MSFSIVSALALLMTMGQVFLHDGNFKDHYSKEEIPQVVELLRASCQMIMKDEDIAKMNPQALVPMMSAGIERRDKQIATAVASECAKQRVEFQKANGMHEEPPACDRAAAIAKIQSTLPKLASPIDAPLELFSDLGLREAIQLYNFMCSETPSGEMPGTISLERVIELYNANAREALSVDMDVFKNPILPQSSLIYSYDGKEVVGEVYQKENRRTWVPLSSIPKVVQNAFISAEDKNFYSHKGVELRGIIRGLISYAMAKGKDNKDGNQQEGAKRTIKGGSTLTQQVIKNVVLDTSVTLERKSKEMMLASRLEKVLNKDQILEIYLNLINLGRKSWGLQMATQNYFGEQKMISDLGLNEATFFAGITHSPNKYEPEFNASKIKERQSYVIDRMLEDGFITQEEAKTIQPEKLAFVDLNALVSSYFQQAVELDVKKRASPAQLKNGGLYIFSTQIPDVQRATELALQDRLWDYELNTGRLKWNGPLASFFTDPLKPKKEELERLKDSSLWLKKIKRFAQLHKDVHWTPAVVLEKGGSKNKNSIQVGFAQDNQTRTQTLSINLKNSRLAGQIQQLLRVGDVVFVVPGEKSAELRLPPQVQGAAIAMETKTGKVIALTGGFSYFDSQFNRVVHAYRQPGSTVKPFTYLAALQHGFQPDQMISNNMVSFSPIYKGRTITCNTWTVRNYSNKGKAVMPLREGLETSSNRVAARLIKEIWPSDPQLALGLVTDTMAEFGVYDKSADCYPVILGSVETNLLRMTAAYSAIANGGTLVEPHFIDDQRSAGLMEKPPQFKTIYSADPISLFQLKNIMGGVVRRGTGYALKDYTNYVAGKTGTSSSYNDAWFVGFSNEIAVGVWIGYDNGSETTGSQGLGDSGTGGTMAAPVAKGIFDSAFKFYPPTELISNPPPGIELVQTGNFMETYRSGASRQQQVEENELNDPFNDSIFDQAEQPEKPRDRNQQLSDDGFDWNHKQAPDDPEENPNQEPKGLY